MYLGKCGTHYTRVDPRRWKRREAERREEEMRRAGPRGGEGRRPCDVFIKRCRLGTKEARLNCAPRDRNGGREVADKRELYKMGWTAPRAAARRGAPRRRVVFDARGAP